MGAGQGLVGALKAPWADGGGGLRSLSEPQSHRDTEKKNCIHLSFRYVRELAGPRVAVLEFQVEIDGISVNGVDMITWNDEGRIVDFKVLIRPLKAVNLIHQKMAAMLQANQ